MNFLLTEWLTRREAGALRLRIDDLDAPRVRAQYMEDVFDTLNWLGILWDTGPRDAAQQDATYNQSLRLARYQGILSTLAEGGHLFACTCSRQDIAAATTDGRYPGTCCNKNLPLDTVGASWREHTAEDAIMCWDDQIMGQQAVSLTTSLHYFIVRRRDGLPAYHLASLADDVDFDINLIIRGADLLTSTAAQLYLAQLLGYDRFTKTTFSHHPLLTDSDGHKLAKSAGSSSLRSARSAGLSAADVREEFLRWKDGLGT